MYIITVNGGTPSNCLSHTLSLSLALLYTSSDCTNTAESQGLPINELEYNSFDYNTPLVDANAERP